MRKLSVETEWLIRKATAPLKEGRVSPARYDKFRDKMVAFIDRPGNYDRVKHWKRRADLLDAVQTDELNPYVNKFRGKFKESSMKLPVDSFFDEILLIKEAGILKDIGGSIIDGVKSAPYNIGRAAGAFTAPIHHGSAGLKAEAESFKNSGPLWKGWQIYDLAKRLRSATAKEDPSGQGKSRVHRVLEGVGSQAGGWVSRPFGLVGGMVGTNVGSRVGGAVGKGIDKVRGYRPPEQQELRGY